MNVKMKTQSVFHRNIQRAAALAIFFAGVSVTGAGQPIPLPEIEHCLLPRPQTFVGIGDKPFGKPAQVEVLALEPCGEPVMAAARRVAGAFDKYLGINAVVKSADSLPAAGKAARVLVCGMSGDALKLCGSLGLDEDVLALPQSYFLHTGPGMAVIAAAEEIGRVYGCQTLIQLMRIGAFLEPASLPGCMIHDWPDIAAGRGQMYDISDSRSAHVFRPVFWQWLVDCLAEGKLTHLGLYLEGNFDFKCLSMGFERAGALEREGARALSEYAWNRGIRLYPLTNFMNHSYGFHRAFGLAPEKYPWIKTCSTPFCPASEDSYALLDQLIGEWCDAFPRADIIHIGGDEVVWDKAWLETPCPACRQIEKEKEDVTPPPVTPMWDGHYKKTGVLWGWRFVAMLNRLNQMVKARGRMSMIWSEPLLMETAVAAEEQDELDRILGEPAEESSLFLDLLDKDIAVMDWLGQAEILSKQGRTVWNTGFGVTVPIVAGGPYWTAGLVRPQPNVKFAVPGVAGYSASTWGDSYPPGHILFPLYWHIGRAERLWNSGAGGGPESFDKAFALQILGVNDPGIASVIRQIPGRIGGWGSEFFDILNPVINARDGFDFRQLCKSKEYDQCKDKAGFRRFAMEKDAEFSDDIATLAALRQRLPDARAAVYAECIEGQARQIQHALRMWETLFRVSGLYAQANDENDASARAGLLNEAAAAAETLLPYYEWLGGFYKDMEAETGCRIGDGRSRLPAGGAEHIRHLSDRLRAAADKPDALPAPGELWLIEDAPAL